MLKALISASIFASLLVPLGALAGTTYYGQDLKDSPWCNENLERDTQEWALCQTAYHGQQVGGLNRSYRSVMALGTVHVPLYLTAANVLSHPGWGNVVLTLQGYPQNQTLRVFVVQERLAQGWGEPYSWYQVFYDLQGNGNVTHGWVRNDVLSLGISNSNPNDLLDTGYWDSVLNDVLSTF